MQKAAHGVVDVGVQMAHRFAVDRPRPKAAFQFSERDAVGHGHRWRLPTQSRVGVGPPGDVGLIEGCE
jgi:hypothetical protein